MQSVRQFFQYLRNSVGIIYSFPIIIVFALIITIFDNFTAVDFQSLANDIANSVLVGGSVEGLYSYFSSRTIIMILIGFILGYVIYNVLYQIFTQNKVDYTSTARALFTRNDIIWYFSSFVAVLLAVMLASGVFTLILYIFHTLISPIIPVIFLSIIVTFTFIVLLLGYPFVSIALRIAVANFSFKQKWYLYLKLFKKNYYFPALKFYLLKILVEIPALLIIGLVLLLDLNFILEFIIYTITMSIIVSVSKTAGFDFFINLYKNDIDFKDKV